MRILKLAGLCGIIAPLIFFSCTFFSIYLTPDFSWTEHALSHLGYWSGEIWSTSGIAAILFNFGTIALGALNIIFAIGIMRLGRSTLCRLGAFILILDMIGSALAGIFPLGTNDVIHKTASSYMFRLASPAFLVLGLGFMTTSDKIWGILSLVIGGVIFFGFYRVPELLNLGGMGNAIPETIFASSLSIYTILMGIRMIRS